MIKTVTGFKVKPSYVTAIQVLPDNIEEVKDFCPVFNYFDSQCQIDYAGYIYANFADGYNVHFNDFIVKNDLGNFKVIKSDDFYKIYDRAEE